MSALAPRTTFSTSRLLEFCSRKELVAQTGHEPDDWPLVIIKELIDKWSSGRFRSEHRKSRADTSI